MARTTVAVNALSTALAILTSVQADPKILKGRTIIDISDKMDVKKMPIGKFLTLVKTLKPVFVQRNDLYRLNNGLAKHLEGFELPQAVFALVFFEGTLYIVDGNTRKRSWVNNINHELPSHVLVTVMVANSLEEAKTIYTCIDSAKQRKSSRDTLVSMFHEAGINPEALISKLIAGGKVVSVVQKMAQAMSGATASRSRKQEVVNQHSFGFLKLDEQNLDEGDIPMAAVWALLRLYKNTPAMYHSYITRYIDELKKIGTKYESRAASTVLHVHDQALLACRAAGVGTSGAPCIPVMFPVYLTGFITYIKQLARMGQVSTKFKAFVGKSLNDLVAEDCAKAQAMVAKKSRGTATA